MSASEYDVIDASNSTIRVGDDETYENKIIDFSNGNWTTLVLEGSNATIRNVGFRGTHRHDQIAITVTSPGSATIENVYLGDGCIRPDVYQSHGQVGIFVHRDFSGSLEINNCNIQNWPNNGIYASAAAYDTPGTVAIRNCYAANNYVSSYRIGSAGSVVENCVAFNSSDGRYAGRCFWGYNPGPYDIIDCDFQSGPYSGSAITIDRGGATAYMEGTQYDSIHVGSSDTLETGSGNGNNPDLTAPSGIPTDPVDAAAGTSGSSPDPDPIEDGDTALESSHVIENVHVAPRGGENPIGILARNGTVVVRDSEIGGPVPRATEQGGEIRSENTNWGENADPTPPEGVPLSALEANGELNNASDPP